MLRKRRLLALLCLFSVRPSFRLSVHQSVHIRPSGSSVSFVSGNAVDLYPHLPYLGTAVAQWLRCCATNRKVAGSIPAGVSGFFIDIKSLRSHYGPGVESTSNRNEYQEYFLGVKAAGA